ncbi:MAG: NAD(P)H-hydrate epimerase [Pseudohongiellaceae bacterium]|jgi:NAD(P)H-hydrate epimerase
MPTPVNSDDTHSFHLATSARFHCGNDLPVSLYTASQTRELDRIAIQEYGIASFTLMRRAARAAFELLMQCWPELKQGDPVTIVCGVGNNGGDGYVMASLAMQYGITVKVIQLGDADKVKGDALLARTRALQDEVEVVVFDQRLQVDEGVIVDALLGTGLNGEVRGDFADAIEWINRQALPILAVDIPSGLCSDTGGVLGLAVNADVTMSFIGLKQGLLTGQGPAHTGDVYYDSLQVPAEVFAKLSSSGERLLLSKGLASLPSRTAIAHKGDSGHVLVLGGDVGMAGAALMASETAARCGAGLVSCATQAEHVSAFISRCPEIMAKGVGTGHDIESLIERASVLVVGPGLGKHPWGEQLLRQAYQSGKPMVVDADALNMMSEGRVLQTPKRDDWILTPHPAEAARLLACATAEVQADRFAAVSQLQQRFGGAVILKGAGTLVASAHQKIGLCNYGNAGMATGGMGDVLSGVLGALLAQHLSIADAARLGVCLHAYAGDVAAEQGMCGTMASDLIPVLRRLVNGAQH